MATFTKLPSGHYRGRVRRVGYAPVSATRPSLAEIRAWARQVEADMDRGVYQTAITPRQMTLTELLTRYQQERVPSQRGRKRAANIIHRLLAHPLSQRRLHTLMPADIAQYRDQRLRQGLNPATVSKELGVLRAVFNHARKEWGVNIANPVSQISLPPSQPHRERRLSDAEEAQLLAAADTDLASAIILLVDTGLRAGELIALTWDKVDLVKRTARVVSYKSGHQGVPRFRVIPLTHRAIAQLQARQRRQEPVVGFRSVDVLSHRFRLLVRRLKLPDLRLHDLRHTCLSRLAEKGWTAAELMALSGHSGLGMLSRYVHVSAEHLLGKLDRSSSG